MLTTDSPGTYRDFLGEGGGWVVEEGWCLFEEQSARTQGQPVVEVFHGKFWAGNEVGKKGSGHFKSCDEAEWSSEMD